MQESINRVIEHGIDGIDEILRWPQDIDAGDLHHRLYNEDYFIIGYAQAEVFVQDYNVFRAMELIKSYEQDNFGEVTTDFSDSEKVANMMAYILGEVVLANCETLKDAEGFLTKKQLKAIQKELSEQIREYKP